MTLASKYSYDFQTNKLKTYKENPIDEQHIHLWTKQNFYRTSYADHWTKDPKENNNVAIPKYCGFIPGVVSNEEYGKSFSAISRNAFAHPKLDNSNKKFSTTGFNFDQTAHIDTFKHAVTRRYGQQQMQVSHPHQHVFFSL